AGGTAGGLPRPVLAPCGPYAARARGLALLQTIEQLPKRLAPHPETTTVRLGKIYGICIAPQLVAEDLLRAEGFTDIRYVATLAGIQAAQALARGEFDFTTNYTPPLAISIDAGEPITILGGEHIGCFELFAREGIRNILDLKGKNVGVQSIGSSQHVFLSAIAAHVALDPAKDLPLI